MAIIRKLKNNRKQETLQEKEFMKFIISFKRASSDQQPHDNPRIPLLVAYDSARTKNLPNTRFRGTSASRGCISSGSVPLDWVLVMQVEIFRWRCASGVEGLPNCGVSSGTVHQKTQERDMINRFGHQGSSELVMQH